jgi:hypothetical protein
VAFWERIIKTQPDGTLLGGMTLESGQKMVDMAYDVALDQIWVATEEQLYRYHISGEPAFEQSFYHSEHIAADGKGGVWIAAKQKLYRMDAAGLIHFEIDPFQGDDVTRIIDLVADRSDGSAWVASYYAIRHVDAEGQVLPVFEVEKIGDEDRATIRDFTLYTDVAAPQLSILAPLDQSYVNTGLPRIILEITDSGGGVDLDSLTIQADGEPLQVDCEENGTELVCTPGTTFAEGAVTLTIQIADQAGNQSGQLETTFTVDTVGK